MIRFPLPRDISHVGMFTQSGWEDYQHWVKTDRQILRRVNLLIGTLRPDHFRGLGKPEPLRTAPPSVWSKRITGEHRLIYMVDGNKVVILQARYHHGSPIPLPRENG